MIYSILLKTLNNYIKITLIFYMSVLILERVKISLKAFKSYWILDVVTRF